MLPRMNSHMLSELLKNYNVELPLEILLNSFKTQLPCISIKDSSGNYLYANQLFAQLMGKQTSKHIIRRNDKELTDNKALLKTIKQHDAFIVEESKILEVCETIEPKDAQHLIKKVRGTLHALVPEAKNKPPLILGLFYPCTQLLSLDLETVFRLPIRELKQLLTKRSYSVVFRSIKLHLSQREIEVILGVVRGWDAGDIAAQLGLKQMTVESYLKNIKNKLGINYKSELIWAVLEANLLGQILL